MLKHKLILTILTCAIIGISSSEKANSATYFEWSADNGYKYLGQDNAYPGGGYFSWLGGSTTQPAGTTGCQDPLTVHNAILSNDTSAAGAVAGSKYALKTFYSGACPNESFQRDTTIISTPNLYEGYFRFYQKWTGDWNSSNVQQKYTKFYTTGGVPIVHFSFGPKAKNWRAYVPNLEGHFDKDGVTRYSGGIWVYASKAGAGTPYTGQNVSYDDYNNGIGGTDGEFYFNTNQWYAIEFHWKVNTDANTSDGVLEAWVDGEKVFGISNFKYFNSGSRPIVNTFELQHIYYNRSATNQPTYMNNIIISDHYNGPIASIKAPANLVKVSVTP